MAKKRANGEGNIRKRKDGRWEGRYTAGVDPETGKPIAKSVLARTQRECKEKLQKAMEELEKIDVTKRRDYTVGERRQPFAGLYGISRSVTACSKHCRSIVCSPRIVLLLRLRSSMFSYRFTRPCAFVSL